MINNSIKRQIIKITPVIFDILLVFTMCITVIAANKENQHNDSTPENEITDITNITTTYKEIETEPAKMESSEANNTTKPSSEKSTETKPVTEKPTKPTEEAKKYTKDDLYYLAAAVCREAGGASEEIQLLVANVIINRVNSSLYPNTIYGVLTQYKQYGTMWKYGVSFPDWADQEVIDQCYSVAKRILEGERHCPENVLFQAEFKQGSGIFKQFGDDYYFCYHG